jgi:tight adherence protein B
VSPAWLAFTAAAIAVAALADLAAGFAGDAAGRAPRMAGPVRAAAEVFTRASREGRDPGAAERRRLLAGGAAAAFASGFFLFGFKGGFLAAAVAPTAASRALRARRERYRRSVEAGAADIAIALADALSGGHSLRGALVGASMSLDGPPRHELRRVAAELELGARTDDALEGMRRRIGSPAIDVIVAGTLLQRRAGGDLAQLLRSSARAFEDEARLLGEVRAATAQARFTGLVVVLLPLGSAVLAELASPGFVGRLAAFPLSAWLIGMAVAMQAGAAFAIRRLARLRA